MYIIHPAARYVRLVVLIVALLLCPFVGAAVAQDPPTDAGAKTPTYEDASAIGEALLDDVRALSEDANCGSPIPEDIIRQITDFYQFGAGWQGNLNDPMTHYTYCHENAIGLCMTVKLIDNRGVGRTVAHGDRDDYLPNMTKAAATLFRRKLTDFVQQAHDELRHPPAFDGLTEENRELLMERLPKIRQRLYYLVGESLRPNDTDALACLKEISELKSASGDERTAALAAIRRIEQRAKHTESPAESSD